MLFATGMLALLGGIPLIIDPSGALNQLRVEALHGSPFHDYLVPGLILCIGIGLYSMLTAFAGMLHYKHFAAMTLLAGLILMVWLSMQLMLMPVRSFLQPVFILLGMALVLLGMYQKMRSHSVK